MSRRNFLLKFIGVNLLISSTNCCQSAERMAAREMVFRGRHNRLFHVLRSSKINHYLTVLTRFRWESYMGIPTLELHTLSYRSTTFRNLITMLHPEARLLFMWILCDPRTSTPRTVRLTFMWFKCVRWENLSSNSRIEIYKFTNKFCCTTSATSWE
jgi:hypothetical protein